MAKKPNSRSRALVAVQTKPPTYWFGENEIAPLEVFRVPEVHPSGRGPWVPEADKISWIDAATGLPCIIRRAKAGFLSGYVGVEPHHPLHGFDRRALPHALDIEVHGGLTYSSPCDENGEPARSVCHIPSVGISDRIWWFGFDCNHSYDLVPKQRDAGFLGAENGRVYRDEAYVYHQCTNLASQLHAIGEGKPKPDQSEPPPPTGLDPYRL